MDFYIAKDSNGINFFKDRPDLVRFSTDDPIEWTGYPINFGDLTNVKALLSKHPDVEKMEEYSAPIHVKLTGLKISIL